MKNIIYLNRESLIELLSENFNYYKKYLDLAESNERFGDKFSLYKILKLVELPHKSLRKKEIRNYIYIAMKNLKNIIDELEVIDTGHSLVFNDYSREIDEGKPWIQDFLRKEKLLQRSASIFINKEKKIDYNYICDSYGFECFGKIKDFIKYIFYVPILRGYDINILFYNSKYFIRIDHHLTIIIIEVKNNT